VTDIEGEGLEIKKEWDVAKGVLPPPDQPPSDVEEHASKLRQLQKELERDEEQGQGR